MKEVPQHALICSSIIWPTRPTSHRHLSPPNGQLGLAGQTSSSRVTPVCSYLACLLKFLYFVQLSCNMYNTSSCTYVFTLYQTAILKYTCISVHDSLDLSPQIVLLVIKYHHSSWEIQYRCCTLFRDMVPRAREHLQPIDKDHHVQRHGSTRSGNTCNRLTKIILF